MIDNDERLENDGADVTTFGFFGCVTRCVSVTFLAMVSIVQYYQVQSIMVPNSQVLPGTVKGTFHTDWISVTS
jgi:hypothetical protein